MELCRHASCVRAKIVPTSDNECSLTFPVDHSPATAAGYTVTAAALQFQFRSLPQVRRCFSNICNSTLNIPRGSSAKATTGSQAAFAFSYLQQCAACQGSMTPVRSILALSRCSLRKSLLTQCCPDKCSSAQLPKQGVNGFHSHQA